MEGSVLLYLTSAGSMARAGAVVSGRRGRVGRRVRAAMVVACHSGGIYGELLGVGEDRMRLY